MEVFKGKKELLQKLKDQEQPLKLLSENKQNLVNEIAEFEVLKQKLEDKFNTTIADLETKMKEKDDLTAEMVTEKVRMQQEHK
tara:strand:- start:160 stop:408 length:249 start_codon:yes stop_codon:yes gene_type:complete